MDRSELKSKTKQELVKIAKESDITGYSRLTKSQLIDLLVDSGKELADVSVSGARTGSAKNQSNQSKESSVGVASRTESIDGDYKDAAEQGRFYVGEGIHEQFMEEHFTFPSEYGRTKIVLMVRDPYWMHTYWEITFDKIEELKSHMGEATFNESKLVLRVKNVTGASADKPVSFYDVQVAPGATNWYINVPNDCASYIVDIGYIDPSGKFYLLARSNQVHMPRAGVSDIIDEEYESLSLEELDKIYALSGGLSVGLSSGEIRLKMKELIEQASFSGGVSSISSGFIKKEKKERNCFLVVNTELIVYGATVPDAKLTIQGQPKKLNPDGTFSARFALPDGLQEIPVKAISSDNVDEITITPIVSKKTV